jgi:hypothetical protein
LYEYFISKGLELISPHGYFSFIVPDRFGFNEQFISQRDKILKEFEIEELLYKAPFPGIVTDTLIFRFKNRQSKNSKMGSNILVGEFGKTLLTKSVSEYASDPEKKFTYESNIEISRLISKIFSTPYSSPIGALLESKTGVILDTKSVTPTRINNKQIPISKGRSIGKYNYLEEFYCEFNNKTIKGGTNDKVKLGSKEKVLLRKTGYPILATFNDSGVYPEQSLYFIINKNENISLKYITALLNSKLFQFIFINSLVTNKDSTPQLKKVDLDKFPVRVLGPIQQGYNKTINEIIRHVDVLMKSNVELKKTSVTSSIELLKDKISFNLAQIDKLIFELYSITPDEIQIIDANM